MNYQIIILAAGKGTRMGQSALPKVLVHLRGVPLISYLVKEVEKLNLTHKPIVVVGHKYDLVQSALGSDRFLYAFQQGQQGTAHATKTALPQVVADNVLVLYGDVPFIKAETLSNFINQHLSGNVFSMLTATVPDFENPYDSFLGFGRIIRNDDGEIVAIREFVDTSDEEKAITEVNPGIYLFKKDWLVENIEQVPKNKNGEYYLTDIVDIANRHRLKITTHPIDPLQVYGINTPQQLRQAEEVLQTEVN